MVCKNHSQEIFLVFWDQRGGRKHELAKRQRWNQAQRPGTTGCSEGKWAERSQTGPIERGLQRTLGVGRVILTTLNGGQGGGLGPEFCRLPEDGRLRAGQRQALWRRTGPGREGRMTMARGPGSGHPSAIPAAFVPDHHTCLSPYLEVPGRASNQCSESNLVSVSSLGSPALIGSRSAPARSPFLR